LLLTASDFCLKPMALSQPGPPLPHPNGGIEQLADIAKVARDKLQEDVKFINNKIQAVHIDMDWHWILGSCIALCAAVMANTGLNLQKLSHLENTYYDPFTRKRPRPQSEKAGMMTRPRWWIGITLIVMASICDFAALSFAAQSIVATLGSLSLVANALIAPMIVNEKITSREWKAIALIMTGDVFAVLFGQHASETYTFNGLMSLYYTTSFAIYAACVSIAIVVIYMSINYIETTYLAPPNEDGSREFRYTYNPRSCVAKYHKFSHAMLSGIIGAQSVLLGKSCAELVKTMIAGRGNLFAHFSTYILLATMVLSIFGQLSFLNFALERFDALIVIPVFQTFWTLVSVIGGFVFYKEYLNLQALQVIMFSIGLGCTIFGVHILAQRKSSTDDEGETGSDRPKYVSANTSGGTGGSGDFGKDDDVEADEHTSLLAYDDDDREDFEAVSGFNMPSASGVTGLVVSASTPARSARIPRVDVPRHDLPGPSDGGLN
jgi:magnesium transporter